MAECLRKGAPGKAYQGWMAEIDQKVGHHHKQQGERESPLPSKKWKRPSHAPCVSVFLNVALFFEHARKVPRKHCLMPKAHTQLRYGPYRNNQFS